MAITFWTKAAFDIVEIAYSTEQRLEPDQNISLQAKFMASESEKKFDEISRRLGVVQEVIKIKRQ